MDNMRYYVYELCLRIFKRLKWILALTFPIWFYWFFGMILKAPLDYFVNAVWFSYYAFFVYMPFMGIGWLIAIIVLLYNDFRKRKRDNGKFYSETRNPT